MAPLVASLLLSVRSVPAQSTTRDALAQKVQELNDAMTRTQALLEKSQHELEEMRLQLSDLQRQIALGGPATAIPGSSDAAAVGPPEPSQDSSDSTGAAIEDLRERQAIQESEIATQEQTKVESESKYPVKITGMLLMNGFKNTGGVDMAASPSIATGGSGNAGATLRQTILGFDALGPHIFGAQSFADLRVDLFGSPAATPNTTYSGNPGSTPTTIYTGYYSANSAFVRLRTAHAGLYWDRTQVYFALDRPILSPDSPTSLTATGVPPLAWSGNLWTWNPQAVVTQALAHRGSSGVELQAALIDVGDAPLTPVVAPNSISVSVPPSSAEGSSRPGVEARIAFDGTGRDDGRPHIGAGGFFAPHVSSLGRNFDSWAGTMDARMPLVAHLEFSGNFYRGAALGGLGGGGYKDFAYALNPNTGGYYFRPLDDAGGWAQLKEKASERLQFNAAFGMDNVLAGQLRHYYVEGGSPAQNLARNRTYVGNVIYSPSAYLLFSLEYRHLESTPVEGLPSASNIIGLGAGYKF
ncbi:MAG: hypothetical protein ACLQDA_13980 [Terracidiphilus sp.]